MRQTGAIMNDSRRLAFRITQEEADALLHILLNSPSSEEVNEEMMEALLCRTAEIQREFVRQCTEEGPDPVRRRLVPQRLTRRRRER